MTRTTVASAMQMPIAILAPKPSLSSFDTVVLVGGKVVAAAFAPVVAVAVSFWRADGAVDVGSDWIDANMLLVVDVEGPTFSGIKNGVESPQTI